MPSTGPTGERPVKLRVGPALTCSPAAKLIEMSNFDPGSVGKGASNIGGAVLSCSQWPPDSSVDQLICRK